MSALTDSDLQKIYVEINNTIIENLENNKIRPQDIQEEFNKTTKEIASNKLRALYDDEKKIKSEIEKVENKIKQIQVKEAKNSLKSAINEKSL